MAESVIITAADVRRASDLAPFKEPVPEWAPDGVPPETVFIWLRPLNAEEHTSIANAHAAALARGATGTELHMQVIAYSAINQDGTRMFEEVAHGRKMFGDRHPSVIMRLANAVLERSSFPGGSEIEAAESDACP